MTKAFRTSSKKTTSTKAIFSPPAPTFTPANGKRLLLNARICPDPTLNLPLPPSRAITRDPTTYPDPETFNPDRWLQPSYPTYQTPLSIYPNIQGFTTFGYGRRVCQGVDLVEAELLVAVGGMAWACQISKKRDERTGEEMVPAAHDYTSLLISRPKMFPFELRARSEGRRAEVCANRRVAEGVLDRLDGMEETVEAREEGVGGGEKGAFEAGHAPRVVVAAA